MYLKRVVERQIGRMTIFVLGSRGHEGLVELLVWLERIRKRFRGIISYGTEGRFDELFVLD